MYLLGSWTQISFMVSEHATTTLQGIALCDHVCISVHMTTTVDHYAAW